MAQFDVYAPDEGDYMLDVQSDWLDITNARVVVPLLPVGLLRPLGSLTPVLHVGGTGYLMATHQLFSTPARGLGRPVANLAACRDDIIRALDLLITGL